MSAFFVDENEDKGTIHPVDSRLRTWLGQNHFKNTVKFYSTTAVRVVSNAGTGPGAMVAGDCLVYIDTSVGGHSFWVFCDGTNRYGHSEDLTTATTWAGLS